MRGTTYAITPYDSHSHPRIAHVVNRMSQATSLAALGAGHRSWTDRAQNARLAQTCRGMVQTQAYAEVWQSIQGETADQAGFCRQDYDNQRYPSEAKDQAGVCRQDNDTQLRTRVSDPQSSYSELFAACDRTYIK